MDVSSFHFVLEYSRTKVNYGYNESILKSLSFKFELQKIKSHKIKTMTHLSNIYVPIDHNLLHIKIICNWKTKTIRTWWLPDFIGLSFTSQDAHPSMSLRNYIILEILISCITHYHQYDVQNVHARKAKQQIIILMSFWYGYSEVYIFECDCNSCTLLRSNLTRLPLLWK